MDSFLIQLDDAPTFLTCLRNGNPFGTSFPTQALAMSFDAAIELCRKFSGEGYNAFVVDRFGQPPTAADLATVKRSVEYVVSFHRKFFVGQNENKQDLGGDRAHAAIMSQEAGQIVVWRLKRMGFNDATLVESSVPTPDVNEELSKIWPEQYTTKLPDGSTAKFKTAEQLAEFKKATKSQSS